MKNVVIYLIGFPGTGKYTVAKEICKNDADFKLVDNHLINNPVFSLIAQDGKTLLPQQVWNNVGRIWGAVLDTMTNISPPDYSFVLTNSLFDDDPDDRQHFKNIQNMAEKREALFIPVRLNCAANEMEKRIVAEERRVRMKETDVTAPKRYHDTKKVLVVEHKNLLNLDNTNISPDETVKEIFNHIEKVKP